MHKCLRFIIIIYAYMSQKKGCLNFRGCHSKSIKLTKNSLVSFKFSIFFPFLYKLSKELIELFYLSSIFSDEY